MDFSEDINEIIALNEVLIRRLSRPLWFYDKQDGWNDEHQQFWLAHFRGLQEDLRSAVFPRDKHRNFHVAIGMDQHGIMRGALYDRCMRIGNRVYRLIQDMDDVEI